MRDYIVYNLRLANMLAEHGHKIKTVGINKNNPKYNIYYFEDSAELRQLVELFRQNPHQ